MKERLRYFQVPVSGSTFVGIKEYDGAELNPKCCRRREFNFKVPVWGGGAGGHQRLLSPYGKVSVKSTA